MSPLFCAANLQKRQVAPFNPFNFKEFQKQLFSAFLNWFEKSRFFAFSRNPVFCKNRKTSPMKRGGFSDLFNVIIMYRGRIPEVRQTYLRTTVVVCSPGLTPKSRLARTLLFSLTFSAVQSASCPSIQIHILTLTMFFPVILKRVQLVSN